MTSQSVSDLPATTDGKQEIGAQIQPAFPQHSRHMPSFFGTHKLSWTLSGFATALAVSVGTVFYYYPGLRFEDTGRDLRSIPEKVSDTVKTASNQTCTAINGVVFAPVKPKEQPVPVYENPTISQRAEIWEAVAQKKFTAWKQAAIETVASWGKAIDAKVLRPVRGLPPVPPEPGCWTKIGSQTASAADDITKRMTATVATKSLEAINWLKRKKAEFSKQ